MKRILTTKLYWPFVRMKIASWFEVVIKCKKISVKGVLFIPNTAWSVVGLVYITSYDFENHNRIVLTQNISKIKRD